MPIPTPAAVFIDIKNNHTLLRYCQNLQAHFMLVNNFGLALDDDDSPIQVYLRNLFVPPYLSTQHFYPEQRIRLEQQQDTPTDWLDVAEVLKDHRQLFILGDPGVGKSTLLSWLMLALSYSGDNLTKMRIGERVPFLLVLRDLPLSQVTNWDSLWQVFLTHNTEKLTAPLCADPQLVATLFANGQALLLIDGLDEVTQAQARRQLGQAVLEGMTRYPQCGFVITSRLLGFDQAQWFATKTLSPQDPLTKRAKKAKAGLPVEFAELSEPDELPVFYLAPFDLAQTRQFINNWYRQYLHHDNALPQRIAQLQERIAENNGLAHLARIPVLLNMICFIHSRRGKLPDGRAELYQRIAETYLTSLDRARNIKFRDREFNYDYLDLCEWLGKLALSLQDRRDGEDQALLIEQWQIKDLLEKELADRGMQAEQINEEITFILDYIEQRSGLFIQRGKNADNHEQYGFTHLSFLEYFAAFALKLEAQLTADCLAKRQHTVNYPWWHECWALFFEQLEHSRLTEKYLKLLFSQNIITCNEALLLASIVMDSGVRLTITARQQEIQRLWVYFLNYTSAGILDYNWIAAFCELMWSEQFDSQKLCIEQVKNLNIKKLILTGATIVDLSPLTGLTQLTGLDLDGTAVTDLSSLAGLTQLTEILLRGTAVVDLSPLAGLTQLTALYLNGTAVADLSPLAGLTQLTKLNLYSTAVTDLSPLAGLTQLTELNLCSTAVTDLSPLAGLTQLTELNLSETNITDLSPLAGLTQLTWLGLYSTAVTDLSPLAWTNPRLNIGIGSIQ